MSSAILNAMEAKDPMIQIALEYRAESKFRLQDYKGAAIDFSNYIDFYPSAKKYPRALLLAGDSYVYLKNNHNN
jgi:TolA-binding protein